MDDQRNFESRLAIIGFTVLVAFTLVGFAFVFLNLSDTFSSGESAPSTDQVVENSDVDASDKNAQEIADAQEKIAIYQERQNSSYLIPVDENNPIPEGYTVELMPLSHTDGSLSLDKAAASAMNAFLAAAEGAGYHVTLQSAYRSEAQQQKLFDEKFTEFYQAQNTVTDAKAMAAAAVGSVNHSEHQLGFAVDFKEKDLTQKGTDGTLFKDYLAKNIHKFGFVLSHPEGQTSNDCHYRYVGLEIAEDMHTRGYSLPKYREFLDTQIRYYREKISSLEKQ